MTDYFGAGIGSFYVHELVEAEGGYNYTLFVNRKGRVLLMRQTIATSQIRWANGGTNLSLTWTNRATANYLPINEI